jgi:hypothetical protein
VKDLPHIVAHNFAQQIDGDILHHHGRSGKKNSLGSVIFSISDRHTQRLSSTSIITLILYSDNYLVLFVTQNWLTMDG